MACNRLQGVPVYKYLNFRKTLILPFRVTAQNLPQSSNPCISLISSPNHFKQSPIFIIFHSLSNPPIKISYNIFKWQNHRRNEKGLPPPPLLLVTATKEPLETHPHQFLLLFHLLDHPHCFPRMINIKDTILNSVIESF